MGKQFKNQYNMKRRTIWEDLFDAAKQYCCCCLFDGCCKCCKCRDECCEEWWYYFCGCLCSDSYLRDDYEADHNQRYGGYIQYGSQTNNTINSTPYSNYHIDLNNNAKYKIIHEDEYDGQQQQQQMSSSQQQHQQYQPQS